MTDSGSGEGGGDLNLVELKNTLRSQLEKSGMSDVIRRMVRNICASQDNLSSLSPDQIMEEVYKKGLMKDFIRHLKLDSTQNVKVQTTNLVITEEDEQFCRSRSRMFQPSKDKGDGFDIATEADKDAAVILEKVNVFNEQGQQYPPVGFNYFSGDGDIIYGRGPMNGQYFLKLEILGGKSFLEHLFDEKLADNARSHAPKFVLHVFYKSQRFRTIPVKSSCEPKFNGTFMIELGAFENGSIIQLLSMNEPLHIILVRDNDGLCQDENESSVLISHCVRDWRPVLLSEKCSSSFPLELMGIGHEHKIPLGLINVHLSILPALEEQISESTYLAHLSVEKTREDEKNRLFLTYAKQWWREFMEIRPEHHGRLVKLFSYDENNVSRPVTKFITPIIADRILRTPYEALRFVKLLSLYSGGDTENLLRLNSSLAPKLSTQSNVLSNHWQSIESTIAAKSGTLEDHAILLCSLLLGFGLDAYVAIGTKFSDQPWLWVITIDGDFSPTFWEATKGEKYEHLPSIMDENGKCQNKVDHGHGFKRVSCIFNNKCFLANIQSSDLIEQVDWHLANPSRWKKLEGIGSIYEKTGIGYRERDFQQSASPSILPPSANSALMSMELENQLKTLITNARRNYGSLQTKWDDIISRLIGQEHGRCELAASSGVPVKLFPTHVSTSILNKISPGFMYKSIPFEFSFRDSSKIFRLCMKEPECEQIIFCRGVNVNHSIRVDAFLYPEEVVCVRVTIACKYIPVA